MKTDWVILPGAATLKVWSCISRVVTCRPFRSPCEGLCEANE